MTEVAKQKYEFDAFLRFVEISRIDADTSSIRQLSPPSPDIICKVSGSDVGFELTALTDPVIERKFGAREFHPSWYRIKIADAVECISRKESKRYSMPNVELIVHEGSTPIDDLWACDESELKAAIQSATDKSPFSKVWLLDISNRMCREYVSGVASA
ncbi:MAG: hypothetical protein JNM58_13405 [Xanthomonadaceae bacterium]|nr:hypothetical protein [Xanthomonadaceae bacterium]